MGNVISFSSTRLEGALTSADTYDFATSYAFAPGDTNDFGVTATLTYGGDPGPITPVITIPPAATDGALPGTFTCDVFPAGVTESSVLCPGLHNTDIPEGTVTLAFTSGDPVTQGYYSGIYAFSVTTVETAAARLAVLAEPTTTVYDTTVTMTSTSTDTLPLTTTTVQSACPSNGTIGGSATGSMSRTIPSSGGMKPSNSTIRPTGTSSFRPSGSISASGSGPISRSNSSVPASGIGSRRPISPSSGFSMKPSGGTGKPSSGLSSSLFSPSESGKPSGSGVYPSGSGPSGSLPTQSSNSSMMTRQPSSSSSIPTITDSQISTTSTSTHVTVVTVITEITTYVPCSSPVATQGSSTIYSSSLTPSVITKTITTTTTETTVICPATPTGEQATTGKAAPVGASKRIVWVTETTLSTTTVCPSLPPPPPCTTTAPLLKRDSGFGPPGLTIVDGVTTTGPGDDSGGGGGGGDGTSTVHEPTSTSTVTETTTTYLTTSTVTSSCSTGGRAAVPLATLVPVR